MASKGKKNKGNRSTAESTDTGVSEEVEAEETETEVEGSEVEENTETETVEEVDAGEEPATAPQDPVAAPSAPKEQGILSKAAAPTIHQVNLETLNNSLARYVEEMRPGKPMDTKTGAANQTALWNTIKFVIAREGSEFTEMYSTLLKVVHENREGCFNERYVYRFHDVLSMSGEQMRLYRRVMHLLMTTCNPKTRAIGLKQLDFKSVLADMVDNNAQQRIVGYYNV